MIKAQSVYQTAYQLF